METDQQNWFVGSVKAIIEKLKSNYYMSMTIIMVCIGFYKSICSTLMSSCRNTLAHSLNLSGDSVV